MVVRIDYDDSSDMEEGLDTEEEFQTGRWTAEEHERFLQGLALYNKQWKLIADLIRTRTVVQVRTHAQKHFQKVAKLEAQSGRPHDTDDDDSGYGNLSVASTSTSTSTSQQLSFSAYPPPKGSSSSSSAHPAATAAAKDGCRRSRRASAIAAASTISAAARTAELESPDPPSPKRRKSSHERSARAASFSSSRSWPSASAAAAGAAAAAAAAQRKEPVDSPAFSKSAAQLAQGAGLHVRSTFPFAQPFVMPRRSPTSVAEISLATMLAPSGAAAALGLAHPWPQHASSASVLSFSKPVTATPAALNNQPYRPAATAAAARVTAPSPWLSGGYGGYGDSYSTHETASSGSGTESEEWGSESGLSGGRGSADILELDLPFGDALLSDDTTVFDAIGALSPAAAAGTPADGALPDFAKAFAMDFSGDGLDLLEPIPLARADACLAVKSAPAAAAAAAAAGGCFAASPLAAAAAEEEQDLDRFVCSLLQVPPQQQALA